MGQIWPSGSGDEMLESFPGRNSWVFNRQKLGKREEGIPGPENSLKKELSVWNHRCVQSTWNNLAAVWQGRSENWRWQLQHLRLQRLWLGPGGVCNLFDSSREPLWSQRKSSWRGNDIIKAMVSVSWTHLVTFPFKSSLGQGVGVSCKLQTPTVCASMHAFYWIFFTSLITEHLLFTYWAPSAKLGSLRTLSDLNLKTLR